MNNLTKFIESVKGNALFALEFLGVMIAIFLIALVAELIIRKKNKVTEKILTTRKIATIGMFSAIAGILMSVEIPIPGVIPETYKFEIGDLPGIICGFAYGPVAGVLVEMCKVFIKMIFRPTSTAFVGELANFVIHCILDEKVKEKRNCRLYYRRFVHVCGRFSFKRILSASHFYENVLRRRYGEADFHGKRNQSFD